jgi:hypothetical protein
MIPFELTLTHQTVRLLWSIVDGGAFLLVCMACHVTIPLVDQECLFLPEF